MNKTKRQLRAEIVERWNSILENPDLNPLSRISISWFVDLLTDDESCESNILTAGQVEDAVYKYCKFYEGGEVDAQAIADKLNATLGSAERTCYAKPHLDLTIGNDFLTQNGLDCSECGGRLDLPVKAFYCPNCGAKVVE